LLVAGCWLLVAGAGCWLLVLVLVAGAGGSRFTDSIEIGSPS
jgi:hypothetical protein